MRSGRDVRSKHFHRPCRSHWIRDVWRKDADNFVGRLRLKLGHLDAPTDHCWIGTKRSRPCAVGQHEDGVVARRFLLWPEQVPAASVKVRMANASAVVPFPVRRPRSAPRRSVSKHAF
jgi:hypothetical protein